ncbi:hypothetical protein GCK72_020285 [Caenorhabditis remanei]|uniref:G-protein coupled receptors family 1 profile domain-containing protein n=1 Tax=Caenorhabditis remanei TaxID=31234 RepID=A0A6A5GEW1_CAERE|nr:hypothetical protein GCK72_020285 [Caenorhabditis remanei]KAF1753728.1 hypothetical protein GCK72_020285 [Caenorhabditis remanei]
MVFTVPRDKIDSPFELGGMPLCAEDRNYLCYCSTYKPPNCVDRDSAVKVSAFSPDIILFHIAHILDLFCQIECMRQIYMKKMLRQGSFFIMVFFLSLTISLRIIFYMFAITISVSYGISEEPEETMPLAKYSMYLDYCSNFLSTTIIFCLSLNRCLFFVAKKWNQIIFDKNHVIFPIFSSFILSISGGVTIVTGGEMMRKYFKGYGFVDVSAHNEIVQTINRMFCIFPIGSIISYIVLYIHLRKRSHLVLTRSSNQNRGEQKVFVQLLITAVLWTAISLVYEYLQIINWGYQDRGDYRETQQTLIIVLKVLNFLPEMSLPFMMIIHALKTENRIGVWIALKNLTSKRNQGNQNSSLTSANTQL